MKVQPEVKKQTLQVGAGTALLSLVMILVYVLAGRFSLPVLLGAVFGTAAVTANFFLLGLSVQKAVEATYGSAPSVDADPAEDQKDESLPGEGKTAEVDKNTRRGMQLSHSARLLLLGVVAVLGWVLPCFDGLATCLPMLFPQFIFMFINKRAASK